MKCLAQTLACCAMIMMIVLPAFATTHNVPADFITIQAGLDASASGDTSNTFIDGNQADRVITMPIGDVIGRTTLIQGFTIRNGNTADSGGGIYCYLSSPTIVNCTFSGNSADDKGGGIYCLHSSSPNISNCTINGNSAGWGGGPLVDPDLGVIVDTNANEDSCDVYFSISLDPMYVNPDNDDYHLQEGSPCIDAGDPDSPLDPDGTVADIGAFYFSQLSVQDYTGTELPDSYTISSAYPNPFNPTTTISVSLPRPSELNVNVYNVTGQQVAELANGRTTAGTQQFTFNASKLAGGVYFVRASANGWSDVQKIVLVK